MFLNDIFIRTFVAVLHDMQRKDRRVSGDEIRVGRARTCACEVDDVTLSATVRCQ